MKPTYDFIVGNLFSDAVSYRVPLYQRHYVWDSINWGHLWDDIVEKSELRRKNSPKQHFTGAIVIQEIIPDALLEIIDGQQRLTTFQIILCAIRDLCDEFEDPMGLWGKVNDYIRLSSLNPLTGIENYDMRYKLFPREGIDRDVFLSLVERRQEPTLQEKNLVWKAYQYFKCEIKTYVADDYDKLHKLHDSIVKDFKVVTIRVTADDEYAKIFRSINGTGRRLAQFDLLRNDLFLRTSAKKRDKLYSKYWHHFEEEPDWQKPKVVDDFLDNFLKVKLGADFDNQLYLFDLYELYCTKLTKKLNLSETNPKLVEYEFYDLSRCSSVYYDMHLTNSEKIGGRIKFYDQFNSQLNVVNQLKLFALFITSEFGLSTRELSRVFNLFEAYIVRGLLHIGSKGYNSPPLRELNSLFLRALDQKKSLSLVNIVYLLSKEWATDQEIRIALDKLPKTGARRKKSPSNLMQELGGRYIFDVLGWEIDHETELFNSFCKKWPSAEVMLQKELIGELPIVYSRIPVSEETIENLSAQTEPRLESYMFVTYQGTRELLEYKIDENGITGVETNNGESEIVTLELEEVLFAFPITATSSLQNYIDRIRDNVKDLHLEPVSKQHAFQTTDWLFEEMSGLQTRMKDPNLERSLLRNTEAITIITRAGYELRGIPKSFNDNAIYIDINKHIVTVYMHGILQLER